MKKLFYFSASLFLLAISLLIGFHLGARTARADWVGSGHLIVGASQAPGSYAVVCVTADGNVWSFDVGSGWTAESRGIPVPIGDVDFFASPNVLIDTSGNAWWWQSNESQWINYGPPPLVTNMQPTTWGNLKTRFVGRGQ